MTADEFRAALARLALPQRTLAQRCGVAVSTVNRWATGAAPVPAYAQYVLHLLHERHAMLTAAQGILEAQWNPASTTTSQPTCASDPVLPPLL